jgi:hypothetical protein
MRINSPLIQSRYLGDAVSDAYVVQLWRTIERLPISIGS